MRTLIAVLLVTIASTSLCMGQALDVPVFFANNDNSYLGGRGLITEEGPTGMFLNPTSGTMAQGNVTAQYCAIVFQNVAQASVAGHQSLLAYGITDWLEIGANVLLIDANFSQTALNGGPFVRVRLFKDEQWWPEVSAGGFLREGNVLFQRRTAFLAASKVLGLYNKFVPAVRFHGGFRQVWEQRQFAGGQSESGQIVYGGAELKLPKHLWLVGEVSNKDNITPRVPYAFGIQLRHPEGYGFTAAAVQNGLADHLGFYIGIGINFS